MLPHLIHGTKQKNKTSNIIDSVSLGFANSADGSVSPLDAPDSDYLHWVDFSDNARVIINSGFFRFSLFTKTGAVDIEHSYTGNDDPEDTGLINLLRAADFDSGPVNYLWANVLLDPDLLFKYPSMTVFFIIQPKVSTTGVHHLISDYGSTANKQMYVRIGDGANLQVETRIRDSAGNFILVNSGATSLSLDTDYLIVAKLDGTNKQVDLWIDGADNAYSGSNAAYDNTNTWEGKYASGANATMGALSQFLNQGFDGYIGSMFITKTALSNADINLYANWMADKWGTTWVNV